MPEIVPFRGLRYDAARAGDLALLLAPPYDVIEGDLRCKLAEQSAHNIVRLILPEGDGPARYANAARTLQTWLDEGALRRDAEPAFYRYHQTFSHDGKEATRRGFLCLTRLHPFDERIILPHERTLAAPKADRLSLKRATQTHLSPVFGLYSDPERLTDGVFARCEAESPLVDVVTGDGVRQRLWRLTDPALLRALAGQMADKKVYIADGHHRYETMLALRDELRPQAASVGPRSAAEFGLMYLTNLDDPGLVVLPTHRLLHSLQGFSLADLIGKVAGTTFDVREYFYATPKEVNRALLFGASTISFAVMGPPATNFYLLSLRRDVPVPGPLALRTNDVQVLHNVLFEQALGLSRESQEQKDLLRYAKDLKEAILAVREGNCQAAFLLNPTPVKQVREVADAGQTMPQKSTYFLPKLASGLVLNPIDPTEVVAAL